MSTSSEPGGGSPAVRCQGLGKAYQFYRRPIDQVKQVLLGGRKRYYDEYWALKDISFSIARGEAVGIIGRNGSGKSTLLQVICGITAPTVGTVRVEGRIAPVLALGAAFDYELTGRENAYLSGAILGLRRAEVTAKMGAIQDLCGLGDFFDQPVKLYSSGMGARLAFAVCAHADGDVLIVDEALAVGDEAFRQRCQALIRGFRRRGTLLFVSHDAGQVADLCDRAIWIDRGAIRADGPPEPTLAAYRRALAEEPDDPNRFHFMN
ncbi:ABC transporter ATP-binding protein [Labrys wisconsinensis]|uniref:Lipopolysaccharide transport system ATP-binding protein n=1 Tax=Labrys wisconsinensis TaxID=425677 RepID=A0ABU0J201_9HYPH|nr:ABC transporter ATP-binding protein [Labrys wisconsinensis]MDQ0467252.1 lipopolysaccharide transport system ATP-binding protein [Labrys wisconsinensis]